MRNLHSPGAIAALIILVSITALGLIYALKAAGLVLAVALGVLVFMAWKSLAPQHQQQEQLRIAISDAAADIAGILEDYELFSSDSSPDHLADRTLKRPELANTDSRDETIARFHYLRATNQRYLHRLEQHLASPGTTVAQLEKLLAITDRRLYEFQLAWTDARARARELGPGTH